MKGSVSVKVQNNRVQYRFTIKRNITILRGESATGKTTLIELVQTYENDPYSGVIVDCKIPCRVVSGEHWQEQLKNISGSLVLIDEGNRFLKTTAFAEAVRNSDNYYVIASRNPLPALPYSVEEVYGIVNKTRGYGQIKRIYSGFKNLYQASESFDRFSLVIVEDSNAGYQFFKRVFEAKGFPCISAKGKSNIAAEILKTPAEAGILVIADGAAFGPEMDQVLKTACMRKVELYLPESFEWLILKSGLIDGNEVRRILDDPADYIESREYFSWERFFNELLADRTQGTYLSYGKRDLNEAYLQAKEKESILATTPFYEK